MPRHIRSRRRSLGPAVFAGIEGLESRTLLTGVITEFPINPALDWPIGVYPDEIAAQPDGTLWFNTRRFGGLVGRIGTDGALAPVPFPQLPGDYDQAYMPDPPVAAPDGSSWYPAYTEKFRYVPHTTFPFHTGAGTYLDTTYFIVHQTAAGAVPYMIRQLHDYSGPGSDVRIPGAGYSARSLVVGLDRNIWYIDSPTGIGRMTPSGTVTTYPVAAGAIDLALGADGNLWFTESTNSIGRMTPTGTLAEFPIPTAHSGDGAIVAGPDGALWFVETSSNKIGRIALDGSITEFAIPTPKSGASDITTGPGGALYFTEADANRIGRITTNGVITEYVIPTRFSVPSHIAEGSDGRIWFTETNATAIGRLDPTPFTGGLAAGSDSGTSASDGITNVAMPNFVGQAAPGSRIALWARAIATGTLKPIGTAVANASASWAVASPQLADGAYTVFALVTDTKGHTSATVLPIGARGQLVIDTKGPRIVGASLDPMRGLLQLAVVDSLSGPAHVSPAGLSNFIVAGRRRPGSDFALTGLAVSAVADPRGEIIVLVLNGGLPIQVGRLLLMIDARGVTDLAGNRLDGEFLGPFLPSGNAHAGGTFAAQFAVRGFKSSLPRPWFALLRSTQARK